MGNKYMQYPATVKALAAEIKTACNDYTARQITNEQIKEIIWWYATKQPSLLFSADKINPTVAAIIGKKRVRLVNELLDGFQHRLGGLTNDR